MNFNQEMSVSLSIRTLCPTLLLGIVIAMSGTATAHPIAVSAGIMPMIDVTLSRQEAIPRQDLSRVSAVVLQSENTVTSGAPSITSSVATIPEQPSGVAKLYALVLSSIGIVSIISLLRLTRRLSMRTVS